MPEYLSPGVYVEEIDTGNKPIEGVSTSTAGMVGVTERGPVNVPILITSYGEYRHWFGERLLLEDFSNALGPHCYLPHAVEGFFQNEGQRVYVTRVLDTNGAIKASENLYYLATPGSPETVLLRTAGEDTGTIANPPVLFVLDSTGLNPGTDWVRIGDGSSSEYRQVNTVDTTPANILVALGFPLALSHAVGDQLDEFVPTNDPGFAGAVTLTNHAAAGAMELDLTFAAAADVAVLVAHLALGPQLVQIGGLNGEYHFVAHVTPAPGTATVVLMTPLAMAYAANAAVQPLTTPAPVTPATLSLAASAGDSLIFPNTNVGYTNTAHVVRIHSTISNQDEIRRIGAIAELEVTPGAYLSYPAASIVEKVDLADDDRHLTVLVPAPPPPSTNMITLDDASGLNPGDTLTIEPGPNQEVVTVQSVAAAVVTFTPDLANISGHPVGAIVLPGFSHKTLTSAAPVGSRVVAVDNRIGLALNDVIRIGVSPHEEYVRVVGLPDQATTAPDAGTVLLDHPLIFAHASGDEVRRLSPPVVDTAFPAPPVALALNTAASATNWVIMDGNNYDHAPLQSARVTTPTGQVFFHRLVALAAIAPAEVSLTMPAPFTPALERAHVAGSPMVVRTPLIEVEAIDAGAWGNRIRIAVEDEDPGLVSRTQLAAVVNPTHVRFASVAGVEVGTVLELLDPLNGNAVVGPLLKVIAIDRTSNYTLTLDGLGLTGAQQAAQVAAVGAGLRLGVRSSEFRLTVLLMHQPDPSLASRSELVLDSEVFRNLSMDPRHSPR